MCVRFSVQHRNHLPRPCLGGQSACGVYEAGRAAMRAYTRPKRKQIIDWIAQEYVAIRESMEDRGSKAEDAAWRLAVETWLHRNGLITVTVGGEVLPGLP